MKDANDSNLQKGVVIISGKALPFRVCFEGLQLTRHWALENLLFEIVCFCFGIRDFSRRHGWRPAFWTFWSGVCKRCDAKNAVSTCFVENKGYKGLASSFGHP